MDSTYVAVLEGGVLLGLRNLALVGLGEGRAGAPGLLYKGGLRQPKVNTSRPEPPQPQTLVAQVDPLHTQNPRVKP